METANNIVWPDSDIGQVVQFPCPCQELLQTGQNASRACVGNYSQGGQWMAVNYSQCDLDISELTTIFLCRVCNYN